VDGASLNSHLHLQYKDDLRRITLAAEDLTMEGLIAALRERFDLGDAPLCLTYKDQVRLIETQRAPDT
jgi:hypothetical protein